MSEVTIQLDADALQGCDVRKSAPSVHDYSAASVSSVAFGRGGLCLTLLRPSDEIEGGLPPFLIVPVMRGPMRAEPALASSLSGASSDLSS